MKTRSIAAGVLALSLFAGAANAMTVQEFLTTANAIPQNPTALLRSDTRRLMAEFRGAVRTVRAEQTQAKAAGRPQVLLSVVRGRNPAVFIAVKLK